MIESRFWRAELKADLRWLRANQRFKRWSEKRVVLFERRLILIACQVRVLAERSKFDPVLTASKLRGQRFSKVGDQPYTHVRGDIQEHFDLESPSPVELSVPELSNQLLHHYEMFTMMESPGQFTTLYVFSDFKRHTCLYGFEVKAVLAFFAQFAEDSAGWYGGIRCEWNEQKKDYVILPLKPDGL